MKKGAFKVVLNTPFSMWHLKMFVKYYRYYAFTSSVVAFSEFTTDKSVSFFNER
jgi:hypothetical protein